MSDLLLVSLGTTRGLRVADARLLDMLGEAGVRAEAIGVRMGQAGRLRRGYPVNDLVEALAARRALATWLARRAPARRPQALLFSTTTAALLARVEDLPYAVRLDAPAALNRPGARNATVRALERRSLAGAELVLALGSSGAAALPAGAGPAVVVPVPVDPPGPIPPAERQAERAVAYVPDPKAKGLARLLAAWRDVATPRRRLDVFGIDGARAQAFLERHGGGPVPGGIAFRGFVDDVSFRLALRRAWLFVSAARWEDYGQAPLEALWEGALLVTVPADGPYEALALARGLAPALVAEDSAPRSLAAALETGFACRPDDVTEYAARARVLLAPYRREAALATLRQRVVPVLLGR